MAVNIRVDKIIQAFEKCGIAITAKHCRYLVTSNCSDAPLRNDEKPRVISKQFKAKNESQNTILGVYKETLSP